MKGVSILGSTGSIGVQTLDVVRRHRERFRVVALAAGANLDLLEAQVREFQPTVIACKDETAASELRRRLGDCSFPFGLGHSREGLEEASTASEVDVVVAGLPGSTGLRPTFAAVEAGKDVALATKEVLVMAGDLFMRSVVEKGVKLLPVDSEQSAIFQCLEGNRNLELRRILLTASGGPFRDLPAEELDRVTREQALDHPRWKMGPKVTVDSATLMNKGLEVIEARWLFDVAAPYIKVVIHPQSIVHSMVEFTDGSILAQLGATDMRIPISYALAYPDRISSGTDPIHFPTLGMLTFFEPDVTKFPLLRAAYQALEEGGAACIILNAADEVAVELFLAGEIPFGRIAAIVAEALDTVPREKPETLEEIVDFHRRVYRGILRSLGKCEH
jgi:1-deoxy-D-xylulose-5-phosphate reductoisomerase